MNDIKQADTVAKKAAALILAQKWMNTDWDTESPMAADHAVNEASVVINALLDALAQLEPCSLSERDNTKSAEQQGLFRKFIVQRVDGSDAIGGKHHGCEYFVLDMDHDVHAPAAIQAYAESCKDTHPELSADLITRLLVLAQYS